MAITTDDVRAEALRRLRAYATELEPGATLDEIRECIKELEDDHRFPSDEPEAHVIAALMQMRLDTADGTPA